MIDKKLIIKEFHFDHLRLLTSKWTKTGPNTFNSTWSPSRESTWFNMSTLHIVADNTTAHIDGLAQDCSHSIANTLEWFLPM